MPYIHSLFVGLLMCGKDDTNATSGCNKVPVRSVVTALRRTYTDRIHDAPGQVEEATFTGRTCPDLDFADFLQLE